MMHTVLGKTFDVRVIEPTVYTDKLDKLLRAGLDEMQARVAMRDDERENEKYKEYEPMLAI